MTTRITQFLVMAIAWLLSFASCTKENRQTSGDIFDDANLPPAEKLIMKSVEIYDTPRILALADSLEDTGDISSVVANYYRGIAAINLEKVKEAESYMKKATANRQPDAADLRSYLKASATLARLLSGGGKNEEALREALPTLAKMDSLGFNKSLSDMTLLTIAIGTSQQNLHQTDEAAATFDKTYQMLRQWMNADTTGREMYRIVARFDNISTCYFNTSQYEKVKMWLNREDSALSVYSLRPHSDAEQLDRLKGIVSLGQAEASLQLGLTDQAAHYYQQFLQTEFSKSDLSRIDAADYLILAGRYREAADNYELLDHVMKERDLGWSLDNIGRYLLPKVRANVLAGRKDSVIAVGMKIAENYDSALTRQRQSDADELANIYDTKGKETMIAQQDAEIARGRVLILVESIVVLTAFFVILTIIRYRAAKRLAKVKAAQERIEGELKIAHDTQMSMVPNKFPDYPGLDMYASMIPAKEVGGDLYSFVLRKKENELYFCIGDVSGKGLPASLFMSQTTRLFNIMAEYGLSPSQICNNINKALSGEDNVNGMFVTMFVCRLNLKLHSLEYCNAGHNPPLLANADGQFSFLDMESNAPIGLWPHLEYVGEEIGFFKDRFLFLYTDGLNEAENLQQEQFGDDRLLDILSANQWSNTRNVVETLAAKVEEHRNGAEPNDDLTMLCLTVK